MYALQTKCLFWLSPSDLRCELFCGIINLAINVDTPCLPPTSLSTLSITRIAYWRFNFNEFCTWFRLIGRNCGSVYAGIEELFLSLIHFSLNCEIFYSQCAFPHFHLFSLPCAAAGNFSTFSLLFTLSYTWKIFHVYARLMERWRKFLMCMHHKVPLD